MRNFGISSQYFHPTSKPPAWQPLSGFIGRSGRSGASTAKPPPTLKADPHPCLEGRIIRDSRPGHTIPSVPCRAKTGYYWKRILKAGGGARGIACTAKMHRDREEDALRLKHHQGTAPIGCPGRYCPLPDHQGEGLPGQVDR